MAAMSGAWFRRGAVIREILCGDENNVRFGANSTEPFSTSMKMVAMPPIATKLGICPERREVPIATNAPE